MDIKTHYDLLIEENNDPFRDPPVLQKYMETWDGQAFLDLMELDESKTVLEIGVGTGRLAVKAAASCRHLTGIDISPKTIARAKENLRDCQNISLVCGDFLDYPFAETFDVIYSSLTMMHFDIHRFLPPSCPHSGSPEMNAAIFPAVISGVWFSVSMNS